MNVQPGSRYVRTVGPCHAHPGRRRQRSLGLYLIHDGLYLIHEMRHFRVQRQADRPDPTRPDQTRPTESRQTDRPTYTHAYTWTHTLTALAFLCVCIYILLYIHIMYTHTHVRKLGSTRGPPAVHQLCVCREPPAVDGRRAVGEKAFPLASWTRCFGVPA